jgi:hypothetical protein
MAKHMLIAAFILLWQGSGAGQTQADAEAQTVYDRIVRASGVSGIPPRLVVYTTAPRGQRIAWFDPGQRVVGIESRTLDLCESTKDPAACMSVFLGHELAHFYKDHQWGGDFGSRFGGSELGLEVKALSAATILLFETQADEAGGFYAHLAGYDSFSMAPTVLDQTYRTFGLIGHEPEGYPSLIQRKEIAQKSAVRLEALIPVWESGALLMGLGRYEEAGRCFDRISEVFPGAAVLNNAGVAYAMEAQRMDAGDKSPDYPWLFDADSRLTSRPGGASRGGVTETTEERRARLLMRAAARLTDAVRRDSGNFPAALNLALLEYMTGKKGSAHDRMDSVPMPPSGLDPAILQSARDIVDGKPPRLRTVTRYEYVHDEIHSSEKVASISPGQVSGKLPVLLAIAPDVSGQPTISISGRSHPDYWEFSIALLGSTVHVLATRPSYRGKTNKQIRAGSSWADVAKVYGPATSKIGMFALYEDFGIAFEGAVSIQSWIVFTSGN